MRLTSAIRLKELYAINGRRPKNGPWNKFNLTKFIIDTDPEIKVLKHTLSQ